MQRLILAGSAFFLLTACQVVGLTSDYEKLSSEQKQLIQPYTTTTELTPKHIYTISGQELKKQIEKEDRAMVYLFTNGCTSKECLPMSTYETFAARTGNTLYLVMSGFGKLDHTLAQRFESPLYAIDYQPYQTKIRNTAWIRFQNDLLGRPSDYKEKSYQGNLFFFEHGKLVKILHQLPD